MTVWMQPEPANWLDVVDEALHEDAGFGDVTGSCLDPDLLVDWYIEVQADGVLSGVGVCEYLFAPFPVDPERCDVHIEKNDGEAIRRGDIVASGKLPARRALLAERTALNFLMHLSGIATLTRAFVDRVEGTGAHIIDTRKTTPGLRMLDKYAVRCGGGHNHRMGLFDGAMIKDNHIAALGSIEKAVQAVRRYSSHMTKIEVECDTMKQVEEAVSSGADVVLLDNMDPFLMREIVKRFKGKVLFEASGGISLDTVKGVAQTGVDLISVGQITHSAPALPFHMELQ
ncbi:MAG TPA: carboxylating nicotinate-nucleotide diphosphorylase [Fimbriimonadaceae bacterium]|nr:carboxylating nicotinate-nucleotide diphosphorylase [Fimbriimonadaceae bacterium]